MNVSVGCLEAQWEERGKKRILRCEKNGNMLHIYVWGQYNESLQILLERGKEGEWQREYNGGVNLLMVHCMHVWNYHNEIPSHY
jgi:hypothetical protein